MTSWIIINLLIAATLSLILSHSPLTSGLAILSMALMTASLFSTLISSWYALLLFLIYIGGMLVMFAYFVALSPNQENISFLSSAPLALMCILLSISPSNIISTNQFFSHHFYTMLTPQNSPTLILLGLLLLLAMVVVVKITNTFKGPLRPFS